MKFKVCTSCKETKELHEFQKRKSSKDGFRGQCKACISTRFRKYWRDNKEAFSAYYRAYRKRNRNKVRAWGREGTRRYREKHPERLRERNWERIGVNLKYADFAKKFEQQGGKCAVCKKELMLNGTNGERTNQACADHDHQTGKFRGILCYGCNGGVVNSLEKDPSLIASAIAYLKQQERGDTCGEFAYQRTNTMLSYLEHIG